MDWSGGEQIQAGEIGPNIDPIDQMDALFKQHDIAGYIGHYLPNPDVGYQYVNMSNVKLYRDLQGLPGDPKLWDPPANNVFYAAIYRELAELYLLLAIDDE